MRHPRWKIAFAVSLLGMGILPGFGTCRPAFGPRNEVLQAARSEYWIIHHYLHPIYPQDVYRDFIYGYYGVEPQGISLPGERE